MAVSVNLFTALAGPTCFAMPWSVSHLVGRSSHRQAGSLDAGSKGQQQATDGRRRATTGWLLFVCRTGVLVVVLLLVVVSD